MREFTDFEKQIIQKLVSAKEIRDLSLIKLIDENTDALAFYWDIGNPYFTCFFNKDLSFDEWYLLFFQVQELIFLIKFLEDNGLIFLHFNETVTTDNWLYNKEKYEDENGDCYLKIPNIIPNVAKNNTGFQKLNHFRFNSDFGRYVKKYANAFFYVSNSLRELVKCDYKTAEQLRFERQLKDTQEKHNVAMRKAVRQINIAWAAFITSIIAVIASFIFGLTQLLIDILLSFIF